MRTLMSATGIALSEHPSDSSLPMATLPSLPEDLIRLIAEWIVCDDLDRGCLVWGEEQNAYRLLLPLSESCKPLRAYMKPLIFKTLHNWNIDGESVWPQDLWPHVVTVKLRDHVAQDQAVLKVTQDVYTALTQMPLLTNAILRYNSVVPPAALQSLGAVTNLKTLEIHQARLDGLLLSSLSFPLLEKLVVTITGFRGISRANDIDRAAERANVGRLLRCVSRNLTFLHLSGDLMPVDFDKIRWPRLQSLAVSEHTPSRQLLVPALTAHMPSLCDLQLLYAADMSRTSEGLRPPFAYGDPAGRSLRHILPRLTALSLSNVSDDDPIFSQLPESLNALHIHARCDPHYGADHADLPKPAVAALSNASAIVLVKRLSFLSDLIEFTISVNEFPTAPLFDTIASRFPRLTYLEASRANYQQRRDGWDCTGRVTRNDTVLNAMSRFPRLRTLKLTLHTVESSRRSNMELGETLRRLFGGIASLQTVYFPWFFEPPWLPWQTPDPETWDSYDRGVLDQWPCRESPQPVGVPIVL
ncbi:unnamed protein product [Mycena citricolor]|uniref:F-box domain-containing protein n=1 Tax=Mycena citricolor TaxID=2018698 RepID=A0AAD2H792_9AGAR|nr:unnamed protein product [Mycena citricolor]